MWLRALIASNLIPDGIVDTRSITDVRADDLTGFTQCHFFAGIGGWPLALQLAGWPEDRPVWTGSCPCQPFSNAGKQLGQADERHLWPVFFNLIRECRPVAVLGEQVASAIGKGWLDGVSADLEGAGYACGATVLGAHSVGAPHIRQRLYWVADSQQQRLERHARNVDDRGKSGRINPNPAGSTAKGGSDIWVADSSGERCGETRGSVGRPEERNSDLRELGRLAESDVEQRNGSGDIRTRGWRESANVRPWDSFHVAECRDGKFRRIPAQSVLLGVADGVSGVVADMHPEHGFPLAEKQGRISWWNVALKGMGNAIVPQVAAEFIQSYAETLEL